MGETVFGGSNIRIPGVYLNALRLIALHQAPDFRVAQQRLQRAIIAQHLVAS